MVQDAGRGKDRKSGKKSVNKRQRSIPQGASTRKRRTQQARKPKKKEAVISGLKVRPPMPSTHSIAPMLSVRNGAKAVEFYKAAFGAGELFRLDDASGAVVARLSAGGAEFWLADESPEHFNFSPETLGGATVRMVMIVEDPDAAFARAVAAGAKVVWPVSNEHGWRVGRVVDPFGHHWEIGKPLVGGS